MKKADLSLKETLIDASDPDALRGLIIKADPKNNRKAALARLYLAQLEDPTTTIEQVAREIGIEPGSLRAYKCRAVSEGWFRHTEPVARLENEGLSKAVGTVIHHIENKNLDAALALLRGFGVFKTHQATRAAAEKTETKLEINIDIPSSIAPSKNIVASPNVIDTKAEVVN